MGPDQGAEGGGTPPPQALNLGVPCLLTKQETCLLTLALLLMDSEGYQSLTARPQCSHLWNRSWGQGPRGTALGRPSRVGFFCSTWALASAGPGSHLAVPAVPRGGGPPAGAVHLLGSGKQTGDRLEGEATWLACGSKAKALPHAPPRSSGIGPGLWSAPQWDTEAKTTRSFGSRFVGPGITCAAPGG